MNFSLLAVPRSWRRPNPPSLRRRVVRRVLAVLVICGICGAACGWVVHALHGPQASSVGDWVATQAQSVVQPIHAEGPLLPASTVNVTAPFDGRIVKRWVQPGDEVKAKAPLVQLDTTEVLAELRDAQVAQMRARETLDELQKWSSGTEVASARRQLRSSQDQLDIARRKLEETRTLYDKGIVARNDLDAAKSEVSSTMEQWHTAQDNLSSVLRKGGTDQVAIARIEFDTHTAKVEQIRRRLAQATLTAPRTGVVLAPSTDNASGGGPKDFEAGSVVSTKDVLVAIGDTSEFAVQAQLDGFDVVRVRTGMPVQITLHTVEALTLRGELTRISAQARRDSAMGSGGPPMFDVQVSIREVPPKARDWLRLGMSARLRIVVEPESTALTVPLAAVQVDNQGRSVVTRRTPAGQGETVIVETGATLPESVVVRRGLAVGDMVWVPRQPAPHAEDPDSSKDPEEDRNDAGSHGAE